MILNTTKLHIILIIGKLIERNIFFKEGYIKHLRNNIFFAVMYLRNSVIITIFAEIMR